MDKLATQAVPEGYKQTEVGIIPKDWELEKLKKFVISLDAGVSVNSVDEIEKYSHGQHVLKTSCVSNGYFYPYEKKSILPSDISRAKCLVDSDTIIISRMNTPTLVGEVGYVEEASKNTYLPDRLWQFRFDKNEPLNVRWLAYLLSFDVFSKLIKEASTGTSGSMKNISKESLFSLEIVVPLLKEQTAIASALSDVDALISELEKLIAKKQAIKTATMQQLLTGKTRLPQFATHPDGTKKGYKQTELGQVPEDWEVVSMGQLGSFGRGRVISHNEINRSISNLFPVYSSQTLNDGVMGYLDTYDFEGEYLTWTTDGVNAGKVFYRNGKFNCTNVCGVISLNSGSAKFIARAMGKQSRQYVSTNLANPKLMNAEAKKVLVKLPCSEEEQTAIATILSDMDSELDQLKQRLAKTRQIKQGMMQELLTGKTRLV